ncbi:glycosyltransferase family 2 protein [Candidatus Peregrinibacteria bacterium]|nr:glycosyltransferase family 2 protein [Candidatus Peregrinibacteria bacterium]
MFFSVVITTYNRADILRLTLDAFLHQSVDPVDYELIVVDDGSKDNTGKVVKTFQRKYKNIKYLKQKNQGQGVARNNGIKIARGEVLVLGQDDIVPTHDFLYEHQKFHYLYPEENAAVLGFTAWHPELKVNRYMDWMVNGSSILGMFGGHQFAYEKLHGKKLANFNFFYTSNISLKTSLLKKFPFDASFSSYGWEDIELGYRLEKEAKLKLYYNSWAVAYHHHYMDERSLPGRMEEIGKNIWIFDKKYPELKKVPGPLKKTILKFISFAPFIWFLAAIKKLSKGSICNLYYYLLSKRYFLKGMDEGKKLLKTG